MIALRRNDPACAKRILPRHYAETLFVTILMPPLLAILLSPIATLGVGSGQTPPTRIDVIFFGAKASIFLSWSGVFPGVLIMGIMQRSGIGGLLPILVMSVALLPILSCVYLRDTCSLASVLRLPPIDTSAIAMSFAALAWIYVRLRVPSGIRAPA